ncbi:MFS general substrate transporter [Aulographum hederae CBS 113979]|uniref:MFS general substrate transporter n=1 Tax=Aulographum hederae CBS 113979 TaxID=1176131 RepID=A0A6G1HBE1_9PEZI|nr:MFS general substrate transporter [Aulographum hederae CBS 113979]
MEKQENVTYDVNCKERVGSKSSDDDADDTSIKSEKTASQFDEHGSIRSQTPEQDSLDPAQREQQQHKDHHHHNDTSSKTPNPQDPKTPNPAPDTLLTRALSRITTNASTPPPPPPDGGLLAWTQVLCGWIVLFTTWGLVNSFGAFQTYYSASLLSSYPPSTISWIGSLQVFLTFFVGAFSGRMLDAGLFLPTFVVGMVLQLAGMFLMSLARSYAVLMATQGLLTGLGGGIFFCPSIGLIATYFSKKRALAIGIATTGNSAGGIIYPLIVRELLPKIGFAWTARVLGFVNLAGLAVCVAFMRPRLPPRKTGPLLDVAAFREPVYMLFVAGLFCLIMSAYYTFYYIASFGVDTLNLSYASSTTLIMLMNGIGIPARLLPPFLADRFGVLNIFLPVIIALTIIAFAWLSVVSVPGFYVWTCFYGLANAAFQCLIPTTVASLTDDMRKVGTRLGMAFSMVSFAALTGGPIGGAIIGADGGSYTSSQAWAAGLAVCAVALIVAARCKKVGWNLKKKC